MRRVYLFGILVLVAVFVACTTTTGGVAPSQPAVQILVPAFGATFVEGENVGIQSIATDPNGISRVELHVDGQLVAVDQAVTQGQTQFNVVQVWVAETVGAHSVVVRAFNTANVPGEASIPIAVTARVALQPTATSASAIEVTATSPPTVVIPTATSPIPTAVPPTQTPIVVVVTATPVPPTPPPPTPIPPTVPPIIFLPPFDGGMDVELSWSDNQLRISAFANDTVVGGDNGDGIAYIDFFIQNLQGNVIATRRENTKPYCFFGEAEGECTSARPGQPNFQWGPGIPIQSGWYLVRAIGYTPDNRIQVAERPLYVNLGTPSQSLFVNVTEPNAFNIEDELVVKAEVQGPSANSGIDRVDFNIVAYDGRIVHRRTEQSADYCGFSGGENNQPCNIYNFKQNGLKWPNGDPVNPTQYIVRAIAYARDGAVAANTVFFQIDRVE